MVLIFIIVGTWEWSAVLTFTFHAPSVKLDLRQNIMGDFQFLNIAIKLRVFQFYKNNWKFFKQLKTFLFVNNAMHRLRFACFPLLDIQEETLNVTVKVRFFILLLLFLYHYSHELMNFVEL